MQILQTTAEIVYKNFPSLYGVFTNFPENADCTAIIVQYNKVTQMGRFVKRYFSVFSFFIPRFRN